ncbi:hypothetical protein LJB85_02965 [Porphyromonadaceae bacterium OttesenSCG-928-L07]|nr:hypothetical protein [Porphyromonadaceae bacterium OttesenSCG-928-L07]MDL2283287.1 hypothetical protein [Odoribacter sp. OttesenSCG-928-G04]
MKKIGYLSLFIAVLMMSGDLWAQKRVKVEEPKYKRSSLCMILIDEAAMPKRDTIIEAFLSSPMPPKYNDHNIAVRIFDPALITLTEADKEAFMLAMQAGEEAEAEAEQEGETATEATPKKKGGGFGGFMKEVGKSAVGASTIVDTSSKMTYAMKANKYMLEEKVAKQLADIWFIDSVGNFSITLMQERGLYNASDFDLQLSNKQHDGESRLKDLGEELVDKTFVVVSRFRYMSKDELVAEIDAMAQTAAALINNGYAKMAADAANVALKASLGAGYYVRTTSYLFQFDWNKSKHEILDNSLWNKHEAYAASDLFSLKYIGSESAFANVKAGVFTQKGEAELIRMAALNATDAVLAKLEKKYDVFKTKTPVYEVNEKDGYLTAFIGTKEGVTAGDKYEVLEKHFNMETKKETYKKVGVVKAVKNMILKNSIEDEKMRAERSEKLASGLLEAEEVEKLEKEIEEEVYVTTFKASSVKGLKKGQLLRQIK